MDELIKELLTPTSQVLLIMGVAELGKKAGISSKYIPILDLMLGIVSGLLVFYVDNGNTLVESIMIGIAIGLSACGLFSGIKNTLK